MQADIARALVRQTEEQVELSRVQLTRVRHRLTLTQRCIERALQILECDGYVLPNVNAPLIDFSEPRSSNGFSTNGHVSDFYFTEIRIADSERETAEALYQHFVEWCVLKRRIPSSFPEFCAQMSDHLSLPVLVGHDLYFLGVQLRNHNSASD